MKEKMIEKMFEYLFGQELEKQIVNSGIADKFIGKYVIIRTRDAGVHVGYLEKYQNKECILSQARRLWSWDGAFTLNGVATKGVESAKMPMTVDEIFVTGVAEIIPCSTKTENQLKGMEVHYDE